MMPWLLVYSLIGLVLGWMAGIGFTLWFLGDEY